MENAVTPRNVLYLIRSWAFGGSHTILLTLMKHLPKDRYNIICVPYDTFSGLDEIFVEQARKRGLPPSGERIPWKSRGNWWKARAKVLELVRNYDIDLIHTHDPHSNTMIGIGRGAWPCAVVASAYGWWDGFVPFRRFVYQWIERDFALHHFDRVITVSDHMKSRIRKGPTPESIVRVIYTGVATHASTGARAAFRAAHAIPGDAVVVGTVSRVSIEKGHTHLIDAVSRLRDTCPKLRALIIGQGPEKAALEDQVRRLGLQDVVKFTGFCDDLPSAFSAMDIFAQPSVQQEGLPTAILEAQAAGLPVVASDIGGVSESVHGGILVRPGDARALANAIESLVKDAAKRRSIGEAAKAFVERSFSLDSMVRRVAETYEEAIDNYAARQTPAGR
jgi:glycosyltransferase involved in cell wall biosynthesis